MRSYGRGLCGALLVLLCFEAGMRDAADAKEYVNRRFGYRVDVPEDLFDSPEEAENESGRTFVSRKDPEMKIRFSAVSGVTEVPNFKETDIPPGAEKIESNELDQGYLLRYKVDGFACVVVRRLENNVLYSAEFRCPQEKKEDYQEICRAILISWVPLEE
jgi:hypothetical protein